MHSKESSGRNSKNSLHLDLAEQLINIYELVMNDRARRDSAAKIVAKLATSHTDVLDLVLESARNYANLLLIDDAHPYSPNAFDILSKVQNNHDIIIKFLKQVVQEQWGISRWNAIRVLCAYKDPVSIEVLHEVVHGAYSPAFYEVKDDICVITNIMGQEFVSTLNGNVAGLFDDVLPHCVPR